MSHSPTGAYREFYEPKTATSDHLIMFNSANLADFSDLKKGQSVSTRLAKLGH